MKVPQPAVLLHTIQLHSQASQAIYTRSDLQWQDVVHLTHKPQFLCSSQAHLELTWRGPIKNKDDSYSNRKNASLFEVFRGNPIRFRNCFLR